MAGVDLAIPEGRITVIVGPSGCGKSSLLMALNRLTDLVPGARVTGRLRYRGEDVLAPGSDVGALRTRVGMIFQRPTPFPVSIRKNLELPLTEHRRLSRAERETAVETALRTVGLWSEVADRLDEPARGLSGGQQQRLCLARALVLDPETILLDEPTSALDPIASGVVEDLVADFRGRYTVVLVTHDLAQARRLADEVAVFWTADGVGCLVERGPREEVFEHPRHPVTRAYLEGRRS